jgi:hypothetical protein
MANHEARDLNIKNVDILMAFARHKDNQPTAKCIRTIIKDFPLDLAILESKLIILGGAWRIHRTVNSRDTEKARKWLLKKLIDNPEYAGSVDSLWRTALLQPEHIYGNKKFLLDIDTKEEVILKKIEEAINWSAGVILHRIETPHGFHLITNSFDTRHVCQQPYVTLIRDGYYFVKKVGGDE